MINHCSFVLHSYKKTVFYTFDTEENDIEEILRPYYNFLRDACDKHGDAIIRVIDALEKLIDENFPNLTKTDCIPSGTHYTFIVKCNHNRIHTHSNNLFDPDIKEIDFYWNAKLIMITRIS